MIHDVFDEVRNAAPDIDAPSELQVARQRRQLMSLTAKSPNRGARDESVPPGVMPAVQIERRRATSVLRGRARVLAAGAAAAALVGAGAATISTRGSSTVTPTTSVPVNGAGAHAILYRLASAAVSGPPLAGRYVILRETDTETGYAGTSERTTVIDTDTGASTTYQEPYAGTTAPSVLSEGPDPSSTEAWFAALPTNPVALRAKLLAIATSQQTHAENDLRAAAARVGKAIPDDGGQPTLSDDDYIYEEADLLLWSPLVGPQLRAALYEVLADTSGFTVEANATDPSGRPAIAMVRHYTGVPETDTTYENPDTGAVLAQVWSESEEGPEPMSSAQTAAQQAADQANGGPPQPTSGTHTITAVYEPVTASDTVPPNPYGS